MVRSRVMGMCLAAMIVAGAVAASSAAALPEFSGPFSKTFTSTSAGSLLETISGKKTKCAADTSTGEITGPQSGTIQLTFTGCKFGANPCNTPSAPSGTIVFTPLAMRIGYLNKAKKWVGADLAEPFGGAITGYTCGPGIAVKLTGSVIGRLTPVNKLVIPAKTFKLKFNQTLGAQEFPNLEGGPVDILESAFSGGSPEVTGLKSTEAILFGGSVTLSA